MSTLIIRTDASFAIGSGHVFRCLTLARELSKSISHIFFVCREQPGDLINQISLEFSVLTLTPITTKQYDSRSFNYSSSPTDYSVFLGCSQSQDLADTLSILHHHSIVNPDVLIVDHYSLDDTWESGFVLAFSKRPTVFVLDDLANRPHFCDILLDQDFYPYSAANRYAKLVPSSASLLLGPSYALLPPVYSQYTPFQQTQETCRIVIYFGGVDQHNYTTLAILALSSSQFTSYHIHVVIGLNCPHRNAIIDIADSFSNFTWHEHLDSLHDLFQSSVLSIGAGGGTMWERVSLGLPTITFPIADNQLECCRSLARFCAKSWMCLEHPLSTEKLSSIICEVLEDPSLHSVRSLLRSICDGNGTSRVADTLLRYSSLSSAGS